MLYWVYLLFKGIEHICKFYFYLFFLRVVFLYPEVHRAPAACCDLSYWKETLQIKEKCIHVIAISCITNIMVINSMHGAFSSLCIVLQY